MPMEVKRVNEVNPVQSKAVHDLNFHLDEMHNRDIEQIILELTEKAQNEQDGRKWAAYEARVLSQKAHAKKNEEVVGTYNDGTRNVWNALSVATQVGAAIISGAFNMPSMQLIGQGGGRAFDTLAESNRNKCDAERTGYQHIYQRKDSDIRDQSQILQEAGQSHERNLNMIDRIAQNQSRLAEMMISGQ